MTLDECETRRAAVLAAVLSLYKEHGRPLKIIEIAERADVSRTATHRYIVWLWANGQLDRTKGSSNGSIIPAGIVGYW